VTAVLQREIYPHRVRKREAPTHAHREGERERVRESVRERYPQREKGTHLQRERGTPTHTQVPTNSSYYPA
jgi:hypothetical protein